MRTWGRAAAFAAALVVQGAFVAPAGAAEGPRLEPIIDTGLDSPRGVAVADDGTIYVVESGTGGDDFCITEGEGEEAVEICYGTTSSITRVDPDGTVHDDWVSGLPSVGFGEEHAGASDVTVAPDGTVYVSIGLGATAADRAELVPHFPPGAMFGTVQRVEPDGTLEQVADIAAWEADNDPDGEQPSWADAPPGASTDSNPNAVLAGEGVLWVADAGGNTVLEVDLATGDVSLVALLEDRFVPAPPFLGAPEGTEIPMQAVPTSLAHTPTGDVAVGQLTGFPFPVGGANVYEVDGTGDETVLAEGFTNIIDVGFRDGELFVLEIAHNSLLAGFEGALVRVRPDGSRIALLRDTLLAPGGMAVAPDGTIVIANGGVFPGGGSLLRFDPSQAADPAIQSACPPDQVEGTDLDDIADTTHEEAITCVAWHGLFSGYGDGTFRPATDISRGQFAAVIARLIEAAGGSLPAGEDAFSDVAGTTHAEAIESLAAAGIVSGYADGTFRPGASLSRAQAATIMAEAYVFVTGEELPAGTDAFADDDDSPHEPNINAAAAAGWVTGVAPDAFAPGLDVRRGQVASILARVASDLVDAGLLTLP